VILVDADEVGMWEVKRVIKIWTGRIVCGDVIWKGLFALFEARHRDQGMLCLHQVVLCEVWRVQNKLIMSNSDTYFLSTG